MVTLILPYIVTISEKKGGIKSNNQGFYPFLKWLGMESGLTPLVWSTVTQYGSIAGSFEAACTILRGWGINISLKRIERLTYEFGKIGINLRQFGSGAIESLIRQVVNLRMKGNRKFWLKENAEIMLHLRCQWMAGNWNNFCDSILTSFLQPKTVG